MEYDAGNPGIILSVKLAHAINRLVTSEAGMHTIDKNMEFSFSVLLVRKTLLHPVPIRHTHILIFLQSTSAHSAIANLPLSAG